MRLTVSSQAHHVFAAIVRQVGSVGSIIRISISPVALRLSAETPNQANICAYEFHKLFFEEFDVLHDSEGCSPGVDGDISSFGFLVQSRPLVKAICSHGSGENNISKNRSGESLSTNIKSVDEGISAFCFRLMVIEIVEDQLVVTFNDDVLDVIRRYRINRVSEEDSNGRPSMGNTQLTDFFRNIPRWSRRHILAMNSSDLILRLNQVLGSRDSSATSKLCMTIPSMTTVDGPSPSDPITWIYLEDDGSQHRSVQSLSSCVMYRMDHEVSRSYFNNQDNKLSLELSSYMMPLFVLPSRLILRFLQVAERFNELCEFIFRGGRESQWIIFGHAARKDLNRISKWKRSLGHQVHISETDLLLPQLDLLFDQVNIRENEISSSRRNELFTGMLRISSKLLDPITFHDYSEWLDPPSTPIEPTTASKWADADQSKSVDPNGSDRLDPNGSDRLDPNGSDDPVERVDQLDPNGSDDRVDRVERVGYDDRVELVNQVDRPARLADPIGSLRILSQSFRDDPSQLSIGLEDIDESGNGGGDNLTLPVELHYSSHSTQMSDGEMSDIIMNNNSCEQGGVGEEQGGEEQGGEMDNDYWTDEDEEQMDNSIERLRVQERDARVLQQMNISMRRSIQIRLSKQYD